MRGVALLLVALLVPACHGGSRGSIEAAPSGGGGGTPTVVEVSWSRDVWPILVINCQLCHTTGSGADQVPDMRMTDSATLYETWVRVFSQCNPNFFRVSPGRSDLSFVVNKIGEVAPLCGQRMPLDRAPLDDLDQATIRSWIDQGALHN